MFALSSADRITGFPLDGVSLTGGNAFAKSSAISDSFGPGRGSGSVSSTALPDLGTKCGKRGGGEHGRRPSPSPTGITEKIGMTKSESSGITETGMSGSTRDHRVARDHRFRLDRSDRENRNEAVIWNDGHRTGSDVAVFFVFLVTHRDARPWHNVQQRKALVQVSQPSATSSSRLRDPGSLSRLRKGHERSLLPTSTYAVRRRLMGGARTGTSSNAPAFR